MDASRARTNARSLLGLAAAALVVAAVVVFAPDSPAQPRQQWRPPDGYALADTVVLPGDHTLRLFTGPSGWYVERLAANRHEAAVGAMGGGTEYTASEVLGGLVGRVPTPGARAVSVGSGEAAARASVHSQVFLVPASVLTEADEDVPVTPLDAAGRPLAGETLVPIAGRDPEG
ncbi:hypothetical protein ABGB16_08400 [Micromonospora sp. B11E3]|uniref:hypothetical protein n=1 Tax=Micromonospora sp. B11E3 TaxID=3153562 RepID=UPI00325D6CB1